MKSSGVFVLTRMLGSMSFRLRFASKMRLSNVLWSWENTSMTFMGSSCAMGMVYPCKNARSSATHACSSYFSFDSDSSSFQNANVAAVA